MAGLFIKGVIKCRHIEIEGNDQTVHKYLCPYI